MIQPGDTCEPVNMLRLINAPNLAYEHLDWFTSKSRISENSTFCLHSPEELEAMISVARNTGFRLDPFLFYPTGWQSQNELPPAARTCQELAEKPGRNAII